MSWGITVERAAAAYEMSGPARRLVHALKYDRVRAVVPAMARAMAPLRELVPFDAALPVPLHRSRERRRGFNQAAVLVEALAWPRATGALVRRKKTESQVGMELHQRRSNVAGAFRYEGTPLTGLRLVLVDDVVTTGATTLECASVLREHGARSVSVISFARANYIDGGRPAD